MHIRPGILSLALPVGLSAAGGCAGPPPPDSRKIDPSAWRSPHELGVQHVGAVVVVEGTAPLAYQAQARGVLRVVDENNGNQVATASARAGQLIAVTVHGVEFGGTPLTGALPADHRYMIYFDIERPEAGPPESEKPEKKD